MISDYNIISDLVEASLWVMNCFLFLYVIVYIFVVYLCNERDIITIQEVSSKSTSEFVVVDSVKFYFACILFMKTL